MKNHILPQEKGKVSFNYGMKMEQSKKQGYQEDGKNVGEWIEFYEDGSIKTLTQYLYGKKNGDKIWFSENGDTVKVEKYRDGQLVQE